MAIQFSKNRAFQVQAAGLRLALNTQKDTGAHPLCFRVGTGRLRSSDPRRSAPLSRITEIRLELRHSDSVGPHILAKVACRFNPGLSSFSAETLAFGLPSRLTACRTPPWGAQK